MGHTAGGIDSIWGQPDNEHISANSYGTSILRDTENVELGDFFLSAARLSYFPRLSCQPFPGLVF